MQVLVGKTIVSYNKLGSGEQEMLILHGWGQSMGSWLDTAKYYSSHFQVTIIDLPGFGSSEEPDFAWDVFGYAEFVIEFMKKVSITKPIIIGHSFGGRIATIIAAKRSELLSRLVLIDSGGIEIKSFLVRLRIILYKVLKPFRGVLQLLRFRSGSNDYDRSSGIMKQVLVKVVNQDLRFLFPKISLSTAVIWGSMDNVLPVSYVKIYRQLIPRVVVRIIWGADHSPHFSKRDDFLKTLDEILFLWNE